MSPTVVVDGSNLATEGRSQPSLQQLNEAVLAWIEEHPDDEVIVVVDATFGHRIAEEERAEFDAARDNGELVSPPAGAIGRGDAFVLRIAEKTGAVVLSNDSFQEFHGEHEWLFTKGRLIGGTPVPNLGWIFTPRTPVRGPRSQQAVREAKRGKVRVGSVEALKPMPVPKEPPPGWRPERTKEELIADAAAAAAEDAAGGGGGGGRRRRKRRGRGRGAGIDEAIATASQEANTSTAVRGGDADEAEGGGGGRRRKRRRSSGPAELPVMNDPIPFLQFITSHLPGSEVEGVVEEFTSHGAFVVIGAARGYVPLSAMGDPPPRAAREVLTRGEERTFILQALDAPRRGIELALPGFEHVAGRPTDETVQAEIAEAPEPIHADGDASETPKPAKRTRKKAAASAEERQQSAADTDAPPAPAKRSRKKAAAATVEAPEAAPVDEVAAAADLPAPAKRARKKAAAPAEAAPRGDDEAAVAPEAASGPTRNRRRAAVAVPGEAEAVTPPAAKAPAKRAKTSKATTAAGAAESAEAPAKAASKAPAKAAKAPAKAAKAAKAPAKAAKAPAESAKVAKEPAKATKAPAKTAKVPAKAAKAPAKAAKKAPVKKAPAKAAAEKATAKKATAKKAAAKEATAKKATAKKAAAPAEPDARS